MDFLEFTKDYIDSRDISDGHAEQLCHCVKMLNRFIGEDVQLDQLSEDLINKFLRHRRDEYSSETRRSRRRMLITLWQEAADQGISPAINKRRIMRIKKEDRIHRAWTLEQIRALLYQADQLKGYYQCGIRKQSYWRSYILAAWDTGMRGCDMRTIRFDAIASNGRLSQVQRKTGKRIKKQLSPATLDAVRSNTQPIRELVWPVWSVMSCWRAEARKLVRRAGLIGSIGKLRHSSGTYVEMINPGRGHQHLGNTRAVFENNYLDHEMTNQDWIKPPSLYDRDPEDSL